MLEMNIPFFGLLRLQYLVLDVNGTIALDGQLLPGVSERIGRLNAMLEPSLVSADTQGTLSILADSLKIKAKRLDPGNESIQKAEWVESLGPARVVAIGNGANDAEMLRRAALGIAIMGNEGLSTKSLDAADVLAPSIETALDLLLLPRRLMATLRT
jgi:P-type E1-E2 ATPase